MHYYMHCCIVCHAVYSIHCILCSVVFYIVVYTLYYMQCSICIGLCVVGGCCEEVLFLKISVPGKVLIASSPCRLRVEMLLSGVVSNFLGQCPLADITRNSKQKINPDFRLLKLNIREKVEEVKEGRCSCGNTAQQKT